MGLKSHMLLVVDILITTRRHGLSQFPHCRRPAKGGGVEFWEFRRSTHFSRVERALLRAGNAACTSWGQVLASHPTERAHSSCLSLTLRKPPHRPRSRANLWQKTQRSSALNTASVRVAQTAGEKRKPRNGTYRQDVGGGARSSLSTANKVN